MRWLKHLTCARRDEKITRLMEQMGAEGYGYYWLICETIAESMDKSDRCGLIHPEAEWARNLRISRAKLSRVLAELQACRLITVVESEQNTAKFYDISVRNLLKYRDEYSKKSGHTPDSVRTKSGECPESVRSKDTDTDTDTDILLDFSRSEKSDGLLLADSSDLNRDLNVSRVTVRKKQRKQYHPLIESLAETLCDRHPAHRTCAPSVAKSQLKKIFAMYDESEYEALAERIDKSHRERCDSFDWTKDEGHYVKSLENWLAPTKRRWDVVPAKPPEPFRRMMGPCLPPRPPQ
jgi:hypothetical protein